MAFKIDSLIKEGRLQMPRLSLVRKIVVGYAAMAFFSIAAIAFSTKGLVSQHKTAREIAQVDLLFINNAQLLKESLVAQERYAGKFAILGSDEFRGLYDSRRKEFLTTLDAMKTTKNPPELNPLFTLYSSHQQAAEIVFKNRNTDLAPLQAAGTKVISAIDTLTDKERARLNEKLERANQREQSTVSWTLMLSFTGFFLASAIAVYITISISVAISKLKKATHRIAEGEFDYDPHIPPGDEIGDLARDFTHMAARLKELEQMSLDASPLTRLPGNIAIERLITKHMTDAIPFAVCYADLDNFKAYNDHYGYIKGSDLIKRTGEIIYDEVTLFGGDDPFVGHIGGDDFMMVIPSDRIDEVCSAVIARFDREVAAFYNSEDVARGSIQGVDRYGVHRIYPIMTISIAVLVCKQGEYESAVEIARVAAQIKDHVKTAPGSNYFVDRRKVKR